MNINFKQSQMELFPGQAGLLEKKNRSLFLFSGLTLSLENIILINIFFLMGVIFSFSLGVEKGKQSIAAITTSVSGIAEVDSFPLEAPGKSSQPVRIKSQGLSPVVADGIMAKNPANKRGAAQGLRLTKEAGEAAVKQNLKLTAVKPPSTITKAQTPQPPKMVSKTTEAKNTMAQGSVPQKSTGAYTIQIASFKEGEYAKKEAADLGKRGYDIFILPKGNYSIVCVGKFSRQEQARIMLGELKRKYKDCIIRRL